MMSSAEENWQFVFLFGLPRSGTTWVGKLFDSHPETLYKHEPDTFYKWAKVPWAPEISETELLRPEVEQFLRRLPNINPSAVAGSLPVFGKAYRSQLQYSAHLLSVIAAKLGRKILRDLPIRPCATYGNDRCLVWKSTNSLGRLGVLLHVAKRRKAIVLVRHPCGVIASLKRGRAGGHLRGDQSTDYQLLGLLLNTIPGKRYGITLTELVRMPPEERLAWKWVLVYEKVVGDITGMEDDVLIVRYEDVCTKPKDWTREMFQLSSLAWNSQTEAFIESTTAKSRDLLGLGLGRSGYFSIFQDPMRSPTRWQHELNTKEIERILGVLKCSRLNWLYPSRVADGIAAA